MTTMVRTLMCLALLGCGSLPHRAEFITEKKALAQANLQSNGILAFEVTNHLGVNVEVDFVHHESQKKYRIAFTPAFKDSIGVSIGPFQAWEKQVDKEVVSESVALFQLPAGTYTPTRVYWQTPRQQQTGGPAKGNSFQIFSGKITSGGVVEIFGEKGLLFISDVRVESVTNSIESGIRSVSDPTVSQREIVPVQIHIAVK